jgi:hypothetical protein
MVKLLAIPPDFESTETAEPEGFVVKVSGRIDRKVDAVKSCKSWPLKPDCPTTLLTCFGGSQRST